MCLVKQFRTDTEELGKSLLIFCRIWSGLLMTSELEPVSQMFVTRWVRAWPRASACVVYRATRQPADTADSSTD